MKINRVREYHPSSRDEGPALEEVNTARRRRGRPRGSRGAPKPVPLRHNKFLGIKYADFSDIPPGLWNLLTSLVLTLFKGMLRVVRKLEVEQRGDVQAKILFVELPKLMFSALCEVATWWWSYDRGFLGSSLKCPRCSDYLKYNGEKDRTMIGPYGEFPVRRSYYLCTNEECGGPGAPRYSIFPLDQRLGLDGQSFLPQCQEVITWLTALDPFGKSLEVLGKLASFYMCHRTAWRITQRVGALAEAAKKEALDKAFGSPGSPVLPKAEVKAPEIGVVMLDGTCGKVDRDDTSEDESDADEGEDLGIVASAYSPRFEENRPKKNDSQPPCFREVKVAVVGHLKPSDVKTTVQHKPAPQQDSAALAPKRKGKPRKVRPLGQEPEFIHKKMAVHLGSPLLLFQQIFLLIHRLALDGAKTILVIGDGARWIWRGTEEHLALLGVKIVQILDYYHCDEHVWELANLLHGKGDPAAIIWARARENELLGGRLDDFFAALEEVRIVAAAVNKGTKTGSPLAKKLNTETAEKALKKVNYFHNNRGRIDYATYLANGYLIGSGAMEGCCKHLVKERIDRSSMRWSAEGAMNVLRNRTLIKNGDWDSFWQEQADQRWQSYQDLTIALALVA